MRNNILIRLLFLFSLLSLACAGNDSQPYADTDVVDMGDDIIDSHADTDINNEDETKPDDETDADFIDQTECKCLETGACCDGCNAINEGASCDDGYEVTSFETCRNGRCIGRICDCFAENECCDGCLPINERISCGENAACFAGECRSLVASCEGAAADAPCDDGNAGTTADKCRKGSCEGRVSSCDQAAPFADCQTEAAEYNGVCAPSGCAGEDCAYAQGCGPQRQCCADDYCLGSKCRRCFNFGLVDGIQINGISFSDDGSLLAINSGGKSRIIRMPDAKLIRVISSYYTLGRLSGDGLRYYALYVQYYSGGTPSVFYEFDVLTGKLTRSWNIKEGVFSWTFAKDEAKVYIGTSDGKVVVFDRVSGASLSSWQANSKAISALAASPDGSLIATSGWDSEIKLWDAASQSELAAYDDDGGVTSLAFSPDGQKLASGAVSGIIRVRSALTNGGTSKNFGTISATVRNLAFSADGAYLSANTRSKAYVISSDSGNLFFKIMGNASAFNPTDGSLAAANNGGLRFYEKETGTLLKKISSPTFYQKAIAVSPDGRTIATAGCGEVKFDSNGYYECKGGEINLWDAANPGDFKTIAAHKYEIVSLVFINNGETLLSVDEKGYAYLTDIATGEAWDSLKILPAIRLDLSPDGTLLAAGPSLFNAADLRHIKTLSQKNEYTFKATRFSRDGKRLTAVGNYNFYEWDLASGETLKKTPISGDEAAISDDGTQVALIGENYRSCGEYAECNPSPSLWIYDTSTGEKIADVPISGVWNYPLDGESAIMYIPGTRNVAAAPRSGYIFVLVENKWLISLGVKHGGAITGFASTPDGLLLSIADDAALSACDIKPLTAK